jgi:MFS family permease
MKIQQKNPTFILSLAAAFEYYDFIIYGLMSSYLGILFFPSDDLLSAQLKAFSVFAIGYIARPIGGFIIGILGDLKGRRSVFIKSNIILSLATIGISVLPNYNQIGINATILLIIFRIIQSLTFAAELPGAMVIMQDGVRNPTKSFSFIISGAALGSIMATLSLYLLEQLFSKEDILDYAWRIPFIFGAILCLISMLMRSILLNFSEANKVKNKLSLLSVIFPQLKNIVVFIMIISAPAYLIMMNIFFPSFIPKFYGYEIKDVYLSITISMIWAVFYAPIFASFTSKMDKLSLIRVIIFSTIFLGLLINFFFLRGGVVHLILGLCIYQSIISSLMVLIFPLMSNIFPKQAQFTLIAVCYNLSYLMMSFAPNIITKLAVSWESPFSLWLGLIILSIFILANMNKLLEE